MYKAIIVYVCMPNFNVGAMSVFRPYEISIPAACFSARPAAVCLPGDQTRGRGRIPARQNISIDRQQITEKQRTEILYPTRAQSQDFRYHRATSLLLQPLQQQRQRVEPLAAPHRHAAGHLRQRTY